MTSHDSDLFRCCICTLFTIWGGAKGARGPPFCLGFKKKVYRMVICNPGFVLFSKLLLSLLEIYNVFFFNIFFFFSLIYVINMNITRILFVQKFELIQVMFDHNHNCMLLNISIFLVQNGILAFAKFKRPECSSLERCAELAPTHPDRFS